LATKTRSLRDDNVCACAVSTLILLSVAILSPKMDSVTLISYKTGTFHCKRTYKGILSKLVKNRKLNYAHARKSLPVAPPKELVLLLGKVNLLTKFDKNRTTNGSAIVETSLKVS